MHAPDWERCLAELCRVANRLVIVDYPSARSVALFQAIGRRLLQRFGGRTEPYRVFRERTMGRRAAEGRLSRAVEHRQFVLPIALHKAIGSRRFSDRAGALSERLGLLARVGSPVTIVAERW